MTGLLTTSGGIFPLSLGRKTELAAGQGVQSADEGLAVVPGDVPDRLLRIINVIKVRDRSHHRVPEGDGHLGLPYREIVNGSRWDACRISNRSFMPAKNIKGTFGLRLAL